MLCRQSIKFKSLTIYHFYVVIIWLGFVIHKLKWKRCHLSTSFVENNLKWISDAWLMEQATLVCIGGECSAGNKKNKLYGWCSLACRKGHLFSPFLNFLGSCIISWRILLFYFESHPIRQELIYGYYRKIPFA